MPLRPASRPVNGAYHVVDRAPAPVVFTIGHGTAEQGAFLDGLRAAGVRTLADMRAFPRSRTNPQFNTDVLEAAAHGAGIAYVWAQALGGRRRPQPGSPNVALRHDAFRAYADYMRKDAFRETLDDVLARSASPIAFMCSETLWWRCHRRLIADALVLLRATPVVHLMPGGKRAVHLPTSGVRVDGDRLVYDVKEEGRP